MNKHSIDGDALLIGDFARLIDRSVDTVRDWERRGLVRAVRTPGGVRLFTWRDSIRRCAGPSDEMIYALVEAVRSSRSATEERDIGLAE